MLGYQDPAYRANISLASAASTHITPPSYMSEVEDPNFKGVAADSASKSGSTNSKRDDTLVGALKSFAQGLVDDLTGKK